MPMRRQPNRNVRPQPPGPKPQPTKDSHYWHRYHYWPYWDYDWYDYDWYDYDDYDWEYAPHRKSKAQRSADNWTDQIDPAQQAYQQGFKDGWKAAMDYLMYGEEMVVEPMPPAPTPPNPPMPRPQGPEAELNS